MKSIKVTVLGRQYPLKVDDSDVEPMYEIAQYVDQRLRTFKNELINQPETTVMVLACLSLAEELFHERQKKSAGDTADEAYFDASDKLSELLAEIKRQNSDI
ncbi:MAG TPA: cell division protein ZapA [Balneolales bacterium]|nr:cell division protein ZapA [Balneolales bacterium]